MPQSMPQTCMGSLDELERATEGSGAERSENMWGIAATVFKAEAAQLLQLS